MDCEMCDILVARILVVSLLPQHTLVRNPPFNFGVCASLALLLMLLHRFTYLTHLLLEKIGPQL